MQNLLDKIGIIDFKYQKLHEQEAFNVFSLFYNNHDEVKLHSRFLKELLDVNGIHKQGDKFLNHFLSVIGIDNFKILNCTCQTEYKNIDIFISNGRQAIIIENKIWAGDQDRQIERYYEIALQNHTGEVWIVYLTLDGRTASENSLGLLNAVEVDFIFNISYSFHILKWLQMCISEVAEIPNVRETLIQYRNTINELTGKTMSQNEFEEVHNLLKQGDNALNAYKIVENWIHIRWHTELNFWTELAELVSEEFEILDHQKFSPDNLNNTIHKSRNRDPWYGIMFKIADYEGDSVCVFIERGFTSLYYGVAILNGNSRKITDDIQYEQLALEIADYCEWGRNAWWLGGKYLKPEINFESFSTEATINLINPEFRKSYIASNWSQIKEFISDCRKHLPEENKITSAS